MATHKMYETHLEELSSLQHHICALVRSDVQWLKHQLEEQVFVQHSADCSWDLHLRDKPFELLHQQTRTSVSSACASVKGRAQHPESIL